MDFPGDSDGKASVYNVGDLGSSPGSGRSPGKENGNPLQHSCLVNPMDTEAWQVGHDCELDRVRHNLETNTFTSLVLLGIIREQSTSF